MKTRSIFIFVTLILLILAGCSEESSESDIKQSIENDDHVTEFEETNKNNESNLEDMEGDHTLDNNISESSQDDHDPQNDVTVNNQDAKESLDQFSSEEIEYARIWIQLGLNQELDELNVYYIQAGEPVNPNDPTSANYPEDVIQLSGSQLVDGSITYSGNGDVTINIYHVPLRWETNVPDNLDDNYMYELTKEMIESPELVAVDVGDDEQVIELIKLLNIHR